jgi:IK cytokine
MMPKAAFQFGVKVGDGRKTAKGLAAGGGKRDQKMENQLHKIKDVLDKQGKEYGGAFEASAMDDVGTGGGVSKKRRI